MKPSDRTGKPDNRFSNTDQAGESALEKAVPLMSTIQPPLDTGHFLEIAILCTRALVDYHSRYQIHRSISPDAFLWDSGTASLKLEGPNKSEPGDQLNRAYTGTVAQTVRERQLPYISPEQTGRLNINPDHRSDLYSLGAVLYQFLTDRLPFSTDNLLELVHSHIAMQPKPPLEIDNTIPSALSGIIMKLLAKAAEKRYQTARGLLADLEKCWEMWEEFGHINSFLLGQNDHSERLFVPHKIYGRSRELEEMSRAFKRVSEGSREIILVSGYAGIGKTALVRELQKTAARAGALFVEGKYDQLRRTMPYSGVILALQELARQILLGSQKSLEGWRRVLNEATGSNGQLIIELVPEFAPILGKQPPLPELGPDESRNRFVMCMENLLEAAANREHPLIMFIDDLQFADVESIRLIKNIAFNENSRYFLFIGTYRDCDLTDYPDLAAFLADIPGSGLASLMLKLNPLTLQDISAMLADMLTGSPEEVSDLAGLILDKTLGNPFFINQIVLKINEEGYLNYDFKSCRWAWDLDLIRNMGFSDNVIDLLTDKISKLGDETRFMLARAACIGTRFSFELLYAISGLSESDLLRDLGEAVWEGLIIPQRELVDLHDATKPETGPFYRFLHDRVQEAAYHLLDASVRLQTHRQIGSYLLESSSLEERQELLFDIVDQLNLGLDDTSAADDLNKLAWLNLYAGRKAKGKAAFVQAAAYASQALRLLSGESWEMQYELAFAVNRDFFEYQYLIGNHDEARRVFDFVLEHCRSIMDQAEIYNIMIVLYGTIGRYVENNQMGIKALRLFGYDIPSIDDRQALIRAIGAEMMTFKTKWGDRPIRDIQKLQVSTTPERDMVNRIMLNMLTPAFVSNPSLLMLLCLKSINDAVDNGVQVETDYVFIAAALILGTYMSDYQSGYEFARLGYELNEKSHFALTRPVITHVNGIMINHWTRPFREGVPFIRETLRSGLETGNYIYAGFSCNALPRLLFSWGHHPLPRILDEIEQFMPVLKRMNSLPSTERVILIKNVALNLMGKTRDFRSLDTPELDEAYHIRHMHQINHGTGISGYYLFKLQTLYMFEYFPEAREMGIEAEKYIEYQRSFPMEADFVVFNTLSIFACWEDGVAWNESSEEAKRIAAGIARMQAWADNCPENFYYRWSLLKAEKCRVSGQNEEAELWYEKALESARANESVLYEALALHHAARFYARRGLKHLAGLYTREACQAYYRWGADGVVRRLGAACGRELEETIERDLEKVDTEISTIDAIAVVTASQAISQDIELTGVLETLMKTVMSNAGAQRGCLLMQGDQQAYIAAEALIDINGIAVEQQRSSLPDGKWPDSIFNYVFRSGETIILDNACRAHRFSADPYYEKFGVLSVLCLPLVRQGRLIGVLYLENNLVQGAFTEDRISVLKILASQAAISLENASLYEERKAMEEELKQLNRKLYDVIEFLPDATLVIDGEGRVLFWNRAMETMSGIKAADIIGKGYHEYALPFYGERRPILIDLVIESDEQCEQQYRQISRDGDYLYGEANVRGGIYLLGAAAVLRDEQGRVAGAIETIRDISESRRAEEERDRLRHLLANIIDSMPSMLVGIGNDGTVNQWNSEAARFTGLDAEAAVGRKLVDVLPTFSGLMDRFQRAIAEQQILREDRIPVFIGGEMRYLELMVYPLVANAVEGAVVRVDDITEKVRMQEMMIQTEKMMSVGGLAAGMAHEINNPLSGIILASQNIINRLSVNQDKNREAAEACGTTIEIIRKYVELRKITSLLDGINSSGIRAAGIISNMLQFSRRSQAVMSRVALADLLDRTVELAANDYDLKKGFDFRHIEMVREYQPDMSAVECQPTEIEQVVLNLLKNSAHATAERQDREQPPRIILRLYQDGHIAVIEVEDNGPGMSEEVKKRIFEPFFTTKEPGVGTGLGLSVSYFIVANNHKGQMFVESEPGAGTRVIIKLPVEQGGI